MGTNHSIKKPISSPPPGVEKSRTVDDSARPRTIFATDETRRVTTVPNTLRTTKE